MFCTACGKEILEADPAFCPHCGRTISSPSSMQQVATIQKTPDEPGLFSRHFAKKCPTCHKRGYSTFVNSVLVSRNPAYTTVKRKTRIRNSQGDVTIIEKPEQILVTRERIRHNYLCQNCKNSWYVTTTREYEGAEIEPKKQQENPVIKEREVIREREVLRIPCQHCKTLVDPVRDKKCPSCGASVL